MARRCWCWDWPAGSARGQALPALVFAHAGGWCLVSLETYDTPCRALANATGCVVFSVDYRLAPEQVLHAAFGWKYDIGPARALGFRTCFVDRGGVLEF